MAVEMCDVKTDVVIKFPVCVNKWLQCFEDWEGFTMFITLIYVNY